MLDNATRENWKLKYRELVTELEHKERDWEALDQGLRSVASRLAIVAMGRDPVVDRHLDSLLDSIRQRAGEAQLAKQLEGLANAVVAQEQDMAVSAALDLSAFVASLPLTPATQRRYTDGLKADTMAVRSRALHELAEDINGLLEHGGPTAQTADVNSPNALAALLSKMAEVPQLQPIALEVQPHLDACSKTGDWHAPLEALATAMRNMIESIDSQKTDLEAFLEQVTRQLVQFESWTDSSQSDAQERKLDADVLEQNVEQQVDGLHREVDAADDSSDLKQRVQKRLDAIGQQLKTFRAKEARRAEQSDKRNGALRQELSRLRLRTNELAQRCGDQEKRLMLDTLTGVHTRYAYEQRVQEEFQRWQRHGQPLSYSIWDIDFFKKVNDRLGHQAGDRLLAAVAGWLSQHTRIEDFVARIGGEEFVILFPSTAIETAATLSDRLREQLAAASFRHKGEPIDVTVSCGVTQFIEGDTPKSVYQRADRALYEAKNSGRNRCVEI
jgi:diguanylate cyclase